MRWVIVGSFAAGIVAASVVFFGVALVNDDAAVVSESSTTAVPEPAQFEVLARGVGAEGNNVGFFYVRYHLYGRTEEYRGRGDEGLECYDAAIVAAPLPDVCR